MKFVLTFILGLMTFSIAQETILPCGRSCKEAYIRSAIKDPAWSKSIWEDIAERISK